MSCRLKKTQISCPHRRPFIIKSGKKNKNKSYRKAKENAQANADKVWPRVVYLAACIRNEHNPCQGSNDLAMMLYTMLDDARFEYALALNDGVPF